MADEPVADLVQETVAPVANATARQPSTPEGMAIAYGSLVVMALLPIIIGSYRSVKHHKEQKVGSVYCRACGFSFHVSVFIADSIHRFLFHRSLVGSPIL